ncbi:MAG: ABC transporter ATP-binding protein/permease [Lachnospiraceae bacterium]|nr:ABC transporter ATP-binding protein/permease [Lachnospiraceae bacterium]
MMKEEKKEKNAFAKRSLREEWKLFTRAVKIWNELLPGFFVCQLFQIAFEAFQPYFELYMSARLINELASGSGAERLLFLAAVTVSGSFLFSAAGRILRARLNVMESFMMEQHEEYILRMQNRHQYKYMEDPDIVLLQSGIRNDFFSFGGGLYAIRWMSAEMLWGIFDLIFSVSLTVSMFTVSAQGNYSGFFAFINSPFSAALIVLMIVVNAWLSIKISTTSTRKSQEALNGLSESNTRYHTYSSLWSRDMIVFDLHRIVLEEMRKHQLHPEWVSKKEKVEIKYGTFSVILEAALNIAIFLFVAAKAFIGVFGIGSFILYQGTVGRFVRAVSKLASTIGRLRYNNGFLVRLYSYLDLPNDMYRGSLAVEKRDDIDYEIEFRDVSFKYPGTDSWVLRHVDMKFRIGDKLAVVGENGSGKTTFIKLLCRLYDPTEGKILLNGIDITRYRYDEYLALFSAVFQDYTLFAFPLGENVAAELSYDAAKVRDCLIRVGLEEKLAELDAAGTDALEKAIGKAYDAEGIDFSGGEVQKIALARAIYKDAPFVVLDEPTAALDPLAEEAVYEAFNRIVKNRTSVFISHRLSSCRFCDMIAVFDHGQIVQKGAHDALVAQKDGKYFQLWTAQAKYYADQGA